MITCESCQSLLLHHLYDLLDDADRSAIAAHLGDCPTCRAALDKARQQQQILAAAAKTEFPSVSFKPVDVPSVKVAPRPVQKPKGSIPWRRWAVAACILLVAGGAGFTAITWYSYSTAADQARNELAMAQRERDRLVEQQLAEHRALQAEIDKIGQEIVLVEAQYRDELGRVQREFDSQPVQFTVTHPKTLQAGGANQITIEAKRKIGPVKGADYQMLALVVDEKTKAEVARTALREGQNDFVLPADLPLKPGTQLSLRVKVAEAGKDTTVIDETLPLVASLYVTHLTTDRPLYRPGEVVYFRSLTLERFSLKPAEEQFDLHFRLVRMMGGQEQEVAVIDPETGQAAQLVGAAKLKDKSGTMLLGPDGKELRGIGAGSFLLPAELPGGEYTLIVSDMLDRFPAEKRKILVNRYQAPRLYKDVDFTRKSYGPGDVVTASCKVSPVEGGRVLADLPVTAVATVDGVNCELLTKGVLKTDQLGQCNVQFRLPAKIDRGEGVLSVSFTDGGNIETTVEPIPIVLNKLKVDMYPEGGELVAGVVNRVYFQARTLLNKPAELRGQIVDKDGNAVVSIKTFSDDKEVGVNQGMGRFEFTPGAGQRYELKIESPEGVEGRFVLPPVQTSGVAMRLKDEGGRMKDELQTINVELYSAGKARKLLVGAYCRGQLLDHQTVKVAEGQTQTVRLTPSAEVGGVCRVTVFEVHEADATRMKDEMPKGEFILHPSSFILSLKPVAERLCYRRSSEKLNLQLFTDKKTYTPGDRVTLSLTATDKYNLPAPAIVLVSVVDKSVLKLRNDRTARAMPTHFLLTSEVRGPEDLEYADVLLREDLPQAEVALDLLLGTQGWRRFVEQKLPAEQARVLAAYKEDSNRLLAVNGQGLQKATLVFNRADKAVSPLVLRHEKLTAELMAKATSQQAKLAAADKELDILEGDVNSKTTTAHMAINRFNALTELLQTAGPVVAVVGLLVLALTLVVIGFVRRQGSRRQAAVYMTSGVLCCLAAFLVVGTMGLIYRVGLNNARTGGPAPAHSKNELGIYARHAAAGKVWKQEEKAAELEGLNVVEGRVLKGQMRQLQLRDDPAQAPPPAPNMGNVFTKAFVVDKNKLFLANGIRPDAKAALDDKEKARSPLGFFQALPQLGPMVGGKGGKKGGKKGGFVPNDKVIAGDPVPQGQFGGGGKGGGGFGGGLGGFGGGWADFDATWRNVVIAPTPFIIRQYAHQHPTNLDNIRRDFAETVYWHPALVLPGDKALDVSFDLSDAVTQFQVQVWGHTLDGRLAALTKDIASRLPFSLDAKLPIEISSTDKIAIPVALTNDTEKNRHVKLNIEADNLKLLDAAEHLLPLEPNSRIRKVLNFVPGTVQGEAKLRLLALCEPFGSDSIERTFKIVPEGFPVSGKQSGVLEGVGRHTIQLPAKRDQWVPGTLKLQAQVFPTTLADLQKGLEAMLREPGGCFEQTSSSNYPNIMILDYLKESNQVQPAIEKRARVLLENGYGKLIAFECIDPKTAAKKQGYEWFGQTAPPHEALTAYGLLQFLDMEKYQPVDQAMLERTKRYLLGQRNGKGGFLRNQRSADSFGRAPDHITDAYIVWALCEAEVKEDISLELNTVAAKASQSEDPYLLSLAGLSLLKRGQGEGATGGLTSAARLVLNKLQAKQKDDGSLLASQTSITHSGGTQLAVETTALAVLAWSRANQPGQFAEAVRKGADWIGKQRGAFGGYGSTQSTVLALKALIAYTRENKKTAEAGVLRVYVNGHDMPVALKAFPAGTVEPLVVELADEQLLEAGENTVRVEITGNNVFPHTLTWSYMALTPANKDVCPVRLTTKLSAAEAKEGQSLRMTAVLENVSGQEQGMAVAIVGLPGGCQLPADLQELRTLVRAGKIDAFEVRGRELVLYWRGLAKDGKHEVNVNVVCQVPGQYRGPASRAYLYYNTDERWWTPPLGVDIK